ncbi:putative phosphatase [Bacillus sp. TS-2]|nr:putative phosphatase [Bacillus sp. TS-2]
MTTGYIFDLDGTVYLSNQVIDGAKDTIEYIRTQGDKVVFLSNNSVYSREEYVNKLKSMDITVTLDEIINSSYVVAQYLKNNMLPGEKVWVLGELALLKELELHQIPLTHDPENANYVIISWDRDFTYHKLLQVYKAWQAGAKLFATNPDRTCPTDVGQIPDCGAIIGAIEGATGEKIDAVIGKPSRFMAEAAVNQLQLTYDQCFMIGDRIETDIKMGFEVGMKTIMVLSGITNEKMLKNSPFKPTYTLKSIKEIPTIMEQLMS